MWCYYRCASILLVFEQVLCFFFTKVWWGYIDSAMVYYLETANEWNVGVMTSQEFASCDGPFHILSLFHDASGELWKVRHSFINRLHSPRAFFSRCDTPVSCFLIDSAVRRLPGLPIYVIYLIA